MSAETLLSTEAIETSYRPKTARWNLPAFGRMGIRGVSLFLFIGLWQLASVSRVHWIINFANVPAPTAVAAALVDFVHSPKALPHIINSVRRVLLGFAVAASLAIPLGIVIGQSRLISDIVLTPLEILRPIPGVAWIPLAILMFPTSEQSMIFICLLGAFFPILLSTIHGVENLDNKLVYAAKTMGAGGWHIFFEVVLPGAMPSIVTGLTIGMGTCWFLVVTAEIVAGQYGIGYFTWESFTLQNYPDIVVGMLIIGVLGMTSSVLVKLIGTRLMPWHRYLIQSR